jgi:DNA-binding CsgD family transcriptional regulator
MNDRDSCPEYSLTVDVGNIPDGAFSVDMEYRIVAWNSGAERVLGLRAEDAVGRKCFDVLACSGTDEGSHTQPCCLAVACARQGEPIPPFQTIAYGRGRQQRKLGVCTLFARTANGQSQVMHIVRDPAQAEWPLVNNRGVPARDSTEPDPDSEAGAKDAQMLGQDVAPARLTPREVEVLRLVARGFSTNDIASTLGISRITARNHVTKVIEKLSVKNRLQAVVKAARFGML